MPQQVTLTAVGQPEPWTHDTYGPMLSYVLTAEGLEGPVQINRKPDSPAPQVGQQVWLDNIAANPHRPGQFKGKLVQDPNRAQNNSGARQSNDDPATRKSIESQVAVKSTAELFAGSSPSLEFVTEYAKGLFRAMQEMQSP